MDTLLWITAIGMPCIPLLFELKNRIDKRIEEIEEQIRQNEK